MTNQVTAGTETATTVETLPESYKVRLSALRARATELRNARKQVNDALVAVRARISLMKFEARKATATAKASRNAKLAEKLAKAEARAKKAQERVDAMRKRAASPSAIRRANRKAGPVVRVKPTETQAA